MIRHYLSILVTGCCVFGVVVLYNQAVRTFPSYGQMAEDPAAKETRFASSSSVGSQEANKNFVEDPSDVSVIQLIANPSDFHNKYVRLIGFLRLGFESNVIYFHQDDEKFRISKNGIWIATEGLPANIQKLDRMYVLVEGTYNAKHKGHEGLYSGSIEKITRLQPWSTTISRSR